MAKISEIESNSIADNLGIKPGDILVSINDKKIKDYIDFQYETADNKFKLTVKKKDNSLAEYNIEKKFGEKLGIRFNQIIFDKLKTCDNNCIFCFINQLPANMRNSLLIKDDDYRFSFLQGSFITLSNINENEFERICNLNLSPLNISVHTTNPELRKKMLGNKKAQYILEQLTRLKENKINFNAQIVLCPGINDGKELDRTIRDLKDFYPNLISLGVVPVGITRYNKNSLLKPYNKNKALKLLNQIYFWQNNLKEYHGKNWLYAADEFYLLAGKKIPEYEHYNGFPQIENGIGLTRLTRNEFIKLDLPEKISTKNLSIITGELGLKALRPIKKRLNYIKGLTIDLVPVKNDFFGNNITVTGLLTAEDIINTIKNKKFYKNIIIPKIVLNAKDKFLDDISINEFCDELKEYNLHFCRNIKEVVEVI
ncbi:MAG: DUF512 domain-containing protein [Halanaerobiaceae bacterium]